MDNTPMMSLSQAAKILPTTNGKRISVATIWRWCIKGCNGVKLKHYRFGKRIAVALPDLLEFGEHLAATHTPDRVAKAPARRRPRNTERTPEQRKAAADAAVAELKKEGVA